MKQGKYPWFPLYVSEWLLASVKHGLTLAAQGAYMRLLCFQWDEHGLPDDVVTLSRLVGSTPVEFSEIWKQIERFFPVGDDGFRRNENLESARSTQQNRSAKAKESAARRWQAGGEEKPPKQEPKKKATPPKAPKPEKNTDPTAPYPTVERVLNKVREALNGSEIVRTDVLRHLKDESPLLALIQLFGEDEAAALYVYAATNWTGGASWSGVFSQRDAIRAKMNGQGSPARKRGGKSIAERALELGVE